MRFTSAGGRARAPRRRSARRWPGARVPARLARDRREPLHEARGHRRRAGELGGAGEDHLGRAERLREVVRRKPDAPLRQIEAERMPHRPAEPRIGARFRRPHALDQPAEHDAIDRLQPRFERTEDAHAHGRKLRPPHHAVGDHRLEQLGIVGARNRKTAGAAGRCRRMPRASFSPSSPANAALSPRSSRLKAAITSSCRAAIAAKGCVAAASASSGASAVAELRDQRVPRHRDRHRRASCAGRSNAGRTARRA